MEVSYENTFDDMVALTEHQISASAAYQKRRRWTLYGSPLLILIGFTYLGYSTQKPALMVGGVAGALFLFFWSLRAYWNFPRKAVEKLQREKPQKEVFCRHNVTVSADGFSEHTAESRHSHTWRSLFDVAFTPDYIFIYDTPATAHIIPRRELGDTRFQQLRDEIERFRNA
jgi:hypothetical protein